MKLRWEIGPVDAVKRNQRKLGKSDDEYDDEEQPPRGRGLRGSRRSEPYVKQRWSEGKDESEWWGHHDHQRPRRGGYERSRSFAVTARLECRKSRKETQRQTHPH